MAKKKKKDNDEDVYRLTPKGLALCAMLECGLILRSDDPRFEQFWETFERDMRKSKYIREEK